MLEDKVVELAQARTIAAVTTLLPDGRPMTQPHWIDTDGKHLVLNTEVHRRKFRNIERDSRVTVMIVDPDNPYAYVEVRGRVVDTVTGPEARSHVDELAQKYTGADYTLPIETERVLIRIAPDRQYIRQ